jgi:hypothetical protein
MFAMLLLFLGSFRVYFQSPADLQTEILGLRHQIVVLQRQTPKPKLKPADRRFWMVLSQFWSRWRSALWIAKPATVIDWLSPAKNPTVLFVLSRTHRVLNHDVSSLDQGFRILGELAECTMRCHSVWLCQSPAASFQDSLVAPDSVVTGVTFDVKWKSASWPVNPMTVS